MGSDSIAERQGKAVAEGRVNSRSEDKMRRLVGTCIGGGVASAFAVLPSVRSMYGTCLSFIPLHDHLCFL